MLSEQKALICLYRYFCLSCDNPAGLLAGGRSSAAGTQEGLAKMIKSVDAESLNSFVVTTPGVAAEVVLQIQSWNLSV